MELVTLEDCESHVRAGGFMMAMKYIPGQKRKRGHKEGILKKSGFQGHL